MRKSGKRKAESGRGKAESGKRKADGACFQLSAFSFQLSGRGGFTLLEVLVSIFVLLFGLLAVAAVIPIAGLRIIQTKQADQAAACGQSAMRDVKVRRMTEPRSWLRYNTATSTFADAALPPSPGDDLAIPFVASFAIDPLGFANNFGDVPALTAMHRFPFYDPASYTTMIRVTLKDVADNPLALGLADRIFTWHDDLQIPVPADPGARPEAIPGAGGNVWQIEGKYSWLATVTPEVTAPDPGAGATFYIDRHRTYRVSVVVFYNRDFSPPGTPLDPDMRGERMVWAEMLGGGYGGGDVRLFLPQGSSDPPSYLTVKTGEWLMLCGVDPNPDNDPSTPETRNVFRWYRVVSAGEDPVVPDPSTSSNATWERHVTLAGPDWNMNWCPDFDSSGSPGADTDNNSEFSEVHAALFTRVIGVYTTTIELDEPGSVWGN